MVGFPAPFDSLCPIEKGVVTLICGPPAVGKTNLCLCTLTSASKPALVDTEGGVSAKRAKQVGINLDSLLYRRVSSFSEQHKVLSKLKIDSDLLVVDSLVSHYRIELKRSSSEANRMLAEQMAALSKYALEKKIAVLVTGQVYTEFDTGLLRICGGDILKYWSKSIIELSRHGENRFARLTKHRSLPEQECGFIISSDGILPAKIS